MVISHIILKFSVVRKGEGWPITSSRLWDQRRISGVKQDQIIHLFKDRNGIEYIYYTRN